MVYIQIDQALDIEPNNVKALMRRGQAKMQSGFYSEAKKDLKKAASLDASNSYVKKLLKICTAKNKAYNQQQQKLYANMFGGGKKKKKKKVQKVEDQKDETASVEKEKAKEDKMDVDTEQVVSV